MYRDVSPHICETARYMLYLRDVSRHICVSHSEIFDMVETDIPTYSIYGRNEYKNFFS